LTELSKNFLKFRKKWRQKQNRDYMGIRVFYRKIAAEKKVGGSNFRKAESYFN